MSVSKAGGDRLTAKQLIKDFDLNQLIDRIGKPSTATYEEIPGKKGESGVLVYHAQGKTAETKFKESGFVYVVGKSERKPFQGWVHQSDLSRLKKISVSVRTESPPSFIQTTHASKLSKLSQGQEQNLARSLNLDRTTIQISPETQLFLAHPLPGTREESFLTRQGWKRVQGTDLAGKTYNGLIHPSSIKKYWAAKRGDSVPSKTIPSVPATSERRSVAVKEGKIPLPQPRSSSIPAGKESDRIVALSDLTPNRPRSITVDSTGSEQKTATLRFSSPLDRKILQVVGTPQYHKTGGLFGHVRGHFHAGLDMEAKVGTKVFAAENGVVALAGYVKGYGKVIYINHPGGYQTRYAHLSEINIKKGDRITQGTLIGKSGKSGNAKGPDVLPHLHFEIRKIRSNAPLLATDNKHSSPKNPLPLITTRGTGVA